MASQVILKKSSVAARVPVPGDLAYGELALNYTDGKLYYKTNTDAIAVLNAGGGVTSVNGSTGAITAANLLDAIKTVDGAGSGLDADLLDGLSSASFAATTHKYHTFSLNTYYHDSYEQNNYLRLFTQNATSDTVRYKTVTSPEYYDYGTSTWTAWVAGLTGIGNLLDGNANTGMDVAHANRTFRFIVSGADGWPTNALVLLQSQWSAVSYTTATVTIASSATLGGTYTSRQVMTFSSANSGNNWGMHGYYTGALHTGETFYQITVDLTDWVDSGIYVTYPLRNLGIFSNFSNAGGIVPYTTGYSKYTDFIGGITTPADVNGRLEIGRYSSSNTASIIDTSSNATALAFRTQYNTQFLIANTASAVNYVQVTGSTTGNPTVVSSQGSDTNTGMWVTSKGTGNIRIGSGSAGYTQLLVSGANNAVNYMQVAGATTGGAPYLISAGSDANVNMWYGTKGAGYHSFFTNDAGSNVQFLIANTASAVNYLQATGSGTGNSVVLSSQGSDTNVWINYQTKGAGSHQFLTNGSQNQFTISHTASAVNYVQVTGSATGGTPSISAQGSDTNIGFALRTKNAGAMTFTKYRDATQSSTYLFESAGGLTSDAAGAFWRGHHIAAPAFTVSGLNKFLRLSNYFEFDSLTDPTYKNVYTAISNGSGLNVEHNFVNDTGGGWVFRLGVGQGVDRSFKIAAPLSTDRNYLQVAGAALLSSPALSAQGTDTNIALVLQSKGTGAIDLVAGSGGVNISNGGTVTAITRTSGGSGYTTVPTVTVSAPTTAGGVQAVATARVFIWSMPTTTAGSGYAVGNTLTAVGGTGTAYSFTVTAVDGSGSITAGSTIVNYGDYSVTPSNPVTFTGGSGSGFTSNMSWTVGTTFNITNAGSGYVEQPTVIFSGGGGSGAAAYATIGSDTLIRSLGQNIAFTTPNGRTGFRVVDFSAATGTGYWSALGGTVAPQLRATGSSAAVILTESGVPIILQTASTEQFRVAHTASAVNYVQVTGAATGGTVRLSAQGSDSSVSLALTGKSSTIWLEPSAGSAALGAAYVASSVNYHVVKPSVAGSSISWGAAGADTNIDLTLVPKGSGKLVASSPLQVNTNLVIDTATVTTTATTANQVLAALDATVYRAIKFLIRAVDATGGKYHTTEILAIHNGTTASSTEYGSVNIGGVCATFDVDYSSSTVRLLTTPGSANSTVFTVAVQLLK